MGVLDSATHDHSIECGTPFFARRHRVVCDVNWMQAGCWTINARTQARNAFFRYFIAWVSFRHKQALDPSPVQPMSYAGICDVFSLHPKSSTGFTGVAFNKSDTWVPVFVFAAWTFRIPYHVPASYRVPVICPVQFLHINTKHEESISARIDIIRVRHGLVPGRCCCFFVWVFVPVVMPAFIAINIIHRAFLERAACIYAIKGSDQVYH